MITNTMTDMAIGPTDVNISIIQPTPGRFTSSAGGLND